MLLLLLCSTQQEKEERRWRRQRVQPPLETMDEHEQANQNGGSLSLSRPVPLHLRLFKCLDRAALTENEQGDDDDDDDNDNGDRDECQMPLPDLRLLLLLLLLTIIIIISSLSLFRFFFSCSNFTWEHERKFTFIRHRLYSGWHLLLASSSTVCASCLRHKQDTTRHNTNKTKHKNRLNLPMLARKATV